MNHHVISGPSAWKGPELDWRREGLHAFSPAHLQEIDQALHALRAFGELDLPDITPEQFPLPSLSATLRAAATHLWSGPGFLLLRGLPRDRYSADDMARIFFGLGAHLGRPLVQSHKGELLGHVMDHAGLEDSPRAYHAGGHLGMHTDSCDIVGLMCLRAAIRGGASRIASSVAIHDHLARHRPDLLRVLYRGFIYRRTDLDAAHGSGQLVSQVRVPAFARRNQPGAPTGIDCYFLGGYARRAAARGDVTLAQEELDAIAAVESLAESPQFHLDMDFAEGDIQFLNNRVLLHGRTDYVDADEPQRRRHLLRLWLEVPQWPRLAPDQVFHSAEDRARWARQRSPGMELPSRYLAAFQPSERTRNQA